MANASQGRVSYQEFMDAAGYIEDSQIDLNDDDIDITFYEGYKDLEDEDKEILRATLKNFLNKKKK